MFFFNRLTLVFETLVFLHTLLLMQCICRILYLYSYCNNFRCCSSAPMIFTSLHYVVIIIMPLGIAASSSLSFVCKRDEVEDRYYRCIKPDDDRQFYLFFFLWRIPPVGPCCTLIHRHLTLTHSLIIYMILRLTDSGINVSKKRV